MEFSDTRFIFVVTGLVPVSSNGRCLSEYNTSEKREYVMSKQLLRSGTSIGANIAESECAISRKDFISKIYIALKECVETIYWLELLADTGFLEDKEFQSINNDCIELKKMMQSITKTMSSEKEI